MSRWVIHYNVDMLSGKWNKQMICFCFCFCALHMRSTTLLLDTKFDMFALLHMYIHISTISKEAIRLSDPPPLFLFFFFFFFFFSQRHTRAHMTEQLHSSWVLHDRFCLETKHLIRCRCPIPKPKRPLVCDSAPAYQLRKRGLSRGVSLSPSLAPFLSPIDSSSSDLGKFCFVFFSFLS